MSLIKRVLITLFLSVMLLMLSTPVWGDFSEGGTGTHGAAPTEVVSSGIKIPPPSNDDVSTQTQTVTQDNVSDASYSDETTAVYTGKRLTKEEIEKMGYEVKTPEEPKEVVPDEAEAKIEGKEEPAGSQEAEKSVKSEGFMERFLSFITRTKNEESESEKETAVAAEEKESAPITESNGLGENESEPQKKETMQKEEVKEEKSLIARFFGLFFR